MYAVIRTGGKQYRVAPGEVVKIESIPSGDQTVEFSDVLAVSGEPGTVARPSTAKVTAEAVSYTHLDPRCRCHKFQQIECDIFIPPGPEARALQCVHKESSPKRDASRLRLFVSPAGHSRALRDLSLIHILVMGVAVPHF